MSEAITIPMDWEDPEMPGKRQAAQQMAQAIGWSTSEFAIGILCTRPLSRSEMEAITAAIQAEPDVVDRRCKQGGHAWNG